MRCQRCACVCVSIDRQLMLRSVETMSCKLCGVEFQLNSAGDIQNLTPNLLSGQWQGRGPLSAAIQMAGIPTG